MGTLGTVLGRLIVALVKAGAIDEGQAEWILQPLKDKVESEQHESEE